MLSPVPVLAEMAARRFEICQDEAETAMSFSDFFKNDRKRGRTVGFATRVRCPAHSVPLAGHFQSGYDAQEFRKCSRIHGS